MIEPIRPQQLEEPEQLEEHDQEQLAHVRVPYRL